MFCEQETEVLRILKHMSIYFLSSVPVSCDPFCGLIALTNKIPLGTQAGTVIKYTFTTLL